MSSCCIQKDRSDGVKVRFVSAAFCLTSHILHLERDCVVSIEPNQDASKRIYLDDKSYKAKVVDKRYIIYI